LEPDHPPEAEQLNVLVPDVLVVVLFVDDQFKVPESGAEPD
jgi:hypothetical protein